MRPRWIVPAAVLLAALAAQGARAAETAQQARGRQRYLALCASCHGEDGSGGGPAASSMRVQPPDLRLIAERHGGFDRRTVAAIIDGREMLGGHGSEDMPVWGWKGLRARKATTGPTPAMLDLLAYLQSIQVKSKP
jgi:mono/diheme cytochrome c family protein